MHDQFQIWPSGPRIAVTGNMRLGSFRRLLSVLYRTIDTGYERVTLDFSRTTQAHPGAMLATLVTCRRHRDERDIEFTLKRPREEKLRRLFTNANWAHLADPARFEESRWHPEGTLPATRFRTPAEQDLLVDNISDAVLSSAHITREGLDVIAWAVSEVIDNVLQHADAPLGGLAQVSHYHNARWLEFVVADAGRGIPDSIRTLRHGATDPEALELAIQKGFTRDKDVGQGNGLFGTHRAATIGEGQFEIHSGRAHLGTDLRAKDVAVPFQGTLLVVRLDYENPEALWSALEIGGAKRELGGDYVERRYEDEYEDYIPFVVRDEASSVGSRTAGRLARGKVENLMRMYPDHVFDLDFRELQIVSSSFADEFIGKLFVRAGALQFMQKIRIRSAAPRVREIIDRAILQRAQQEA